MIAKWYGRVLQDILSGETLDWERDTIKVGLLGSAYRPGQLDRSWADVVNYEIDGPGYEPGGQTLQTSSPTFREGSIELHAKGAEWTAATLVTHYGIIYKSLDDPMDSLLLGYVDFGKAQSVVSGILALAWDNNPLLAIKIM